MFVNDTVQQMIHTITPWALASVTLYVMLIGYQILLMQRQGLIVQDSIKMVGIVIISALALNADTYLTWVVNTLQGFETSMTAAVTGRQDTTLWAALDGTLDHGFSLFQICTLRAIEAGWLHIGAMCVWLMAGIMIAVSFGLIVIAGGALILIASALLKVVFAVGPFFLLCLMFPITRHFFDRWLGKAMTYMFQVVTVAAVLTIAVRVY